MTEKLFPTISVGQRLYWVPGDNQQKPDWVEVTKVGTKWVYFGYRQRFDKQTLRVDGDTSIRGGRIYLLEQTYLDEVRALALFRKIQNVFSWHRGGRELDLETLEKIAALLNLEEPESDSQPCSGT